MHGIKQTSLTHHNSSKDRNGYFPSLIFIRVALRYVPISCITGGRPATCIHPHIHNQNHTRSLTMHAIAQIAVRHTYHCTKGSPKQQRHIHNTTSDIHGHNSVHKKNSLQSICLDTQLVNFRHFLIIFLFFFVKNLLPSLVFIIRFTTGEKIITVTKLQLFASQVEEKVQTLGENAKMQFERSMEPADTRGHTMSMKRHVRKWLEHTTTLALRS